MSTPIGHSLAGYIITGRKSGKTTAGTIGIYAAAAAAANLPDIDFLFGYVRGQPNMYHHQWTHSLGFALAAGLTVLLVLRAVKKEWNLRAGFLTFFLVVSHLVIDLVTRDTSFPYGIQLFWPFTERYYIVRPAVFLDTVRASTQEAFIPSLFCYHNLITVLRELVILVPLAVVFSVLARGNVMRKMFRRSR